MSAPVQWCWRNVYRDPNGRRWIGPLEFFDRPAANARAASLADAGRFGPYGGPAPIHKRVACCRARHRRLDREVGRSLGERKAGS